VRPCKSCPFRADTLLGLWEAAHYVAIAYLGSADNPLLAADTMGCHKWNGIVDARRKPENSPVCGGWIRAARDAPVIRLLAIRGRIDPGDLDDMDGILSVEEMARNNGIDTDKLPPLRWRPRLEGWPDPQAWMEAIVTLRKQILAQPELALQYVIPGSPLDRRPTEAQICAALGTHAAEAYCAKGLE